MTLKLITEIDLETKEHKRYFQLDLPVALYAGYTQVVSFNAFFHGRKDRNWSPKYLYHAQDLEDVFEYKRDNMKKNTPIKVDTIWEFYKQIGYDHKRNKWGNT